MADSNHDDERNEHRRSRDNAVAQRIWALPSTRTSTRSWRTGPTPARPARVADARISEKMQCSVLMWRTGYEHL